MAERIFRTVQTKPIFQTGGTVSNTKQTDFRRKQRKKKKTKPNFSRRYKKTKPNYRKRLRPLVSKKDLVASKKDQPKTFSASLETISLEIFFLDLQISQQSERPWWVARLNFSYLIESFNPGGRFLIIQSSGL